MRQLLSLFLSLVLLTSLTACGQTDPPDGSTSAISAGDVSQSGTDNPVLPPLTLPVFPSFSLHPSLGVNRANLTLSPLLYEGLFQLDAHFQPVPVLCKDYTANASQTVWTFTLGSGITFSNGTPLTGQVVADALNLARSDQGRYASRLTNVSSIVASEDTVTITLTRANGGLPTLLDIPIALGSGTRPAGTGPYQLSGSDKHLVLTLRSDWWQHKPLPFETIPLHSVDKSDELVYAFDAGNLSLLDVDLLSTNALGYGGNYQTWDYATTDLVYLGFNTRFGPCYSSEVRRALSAAIDRSAIAQITYASHAVPSPLPVHPDSPLFDREIASQLAYNPDILASRLKSLGLSKRVLKLLVNSENSAKVTTAQLIAYQLESAGLSIQLEQLPYEDYVAALKWGGFDLYVGETVLTADFNLAPLLSSTGSLNYSGWQDWTTSTLISALNAASTDEDRQLAASKLFTHLAQQAPMTPLVFKNGSALTQWGRLTGLNPLRGNVFYQLENWTMQ